MAEVPLQARHAPLTRIITEIGQTEPRAEHLESEDGQLRLELSEHPVFLEPRRE